jgi:hypothetical protein
MNIYLDIDGTMIHENLAEPEAAAGLEAFIVALRPHNTYWLTTHCRDGNPERPREIMKRFLSPKLHADIDRIKPIVWDVMKTEGIDWSHDFIWFDDTITEMEWKRFESAGPNQQVIEMNLRENPQQLIEVTKDILVSLYK